MKLFQAVKLITDKYTSEGIKTGDIGYILEDLDGENCEVEFSDKDGITIALHSFHKDELELYEDIPDINISEDMSSYQADDPGLVNIKYEREAVEKKPESKRHTKKKRSCWVDAALNLVVAGAWFCLGIFRHFTGIFYVIPLAWLGIAVYRLYKCYYNVNDN